MRFTASRRSTAVRELAPFLIEFENFTVILPTVKEVRDVRFPAVQFILKTEVENRGLLRFLLLSNFLEN